MLKRKLISKMLCFNHLHRKKIHSILEEAGIFHGQLPILECIEEKEQCTLREIAKELRVSPPSITNSIKRLEKSGMIVKTVSNDDLRYTYITLTPKGQEALENAIDQCNKVDEESFKNISDEEIALLSDIYDKLVKNMEEDEEHDKNP